MTDLPRLIEPMLASLRHEFPADEEAYGWELKWDGLRAVAYVERRHGAAGLAKREGHGRAAIPSSACPGPSGPAPR